MRQSGRLYIADHCVPFVDRIQERISLGIFAKLIRDLPKVSFIFRRQGGDFSLFGLLRLMLIVAVGLVATTFVGTVDHVVFKKLVNFRLG